MPLRDKLLEWGTDLVGPWIGSGHIPYSSIWTLWQSPPLASASMEKLSADHLPHERPIPQSYTLWNSSIILCYNQHTPSWAMHRRKKKKQLFLSSLLQPPPWLLYLLAHTASRSGSHMTLIFHVSGHLVFDFSFDFHTSLNKNSGLSCWVFHQIFPLWLFIYFSLSLKMKLQGLSSKGFVISKINLSPTCTSLPLPLFHLSFQCFYHKISYTAQ